MEVREREGGRGRERERGERGGEREGERGGKRGGGEGGDVASRNTYNDQERTQHEDGADNPSSAEEETNDAGDKENGRASDSIISCDDISFTVGSNHAPNSNAKAKN